MSFTIEEMNLLAIYSPAGRMLTIEHLNQALPDVHEPEMQELIHSTLAKLDAMGDAEYDALDIFAEDYFDDMED